MNKTEVELLPMVVDAAESNYVLSKFEQPVYEPTVQMPLQPPHQRNYHKYLPIIPITKFYH